MRADLWGVGLDGKGGGRYQGWEAVVYPTYIAAAVILIVGVGFAPDTSIKTWASSEAAARLNLKDAGAVETFEFGTHYAKEEELYKFAAEDIDKMPTSNAKFNLMSRPTRRAEKLAAE